MAVAGWLWLAQLLAMSLCTSAAEGIPPGQWGGQHISLEITKTGGRLEFDCAHGEFDGRLQPDRQGRFSTEGIYIEEHGGPTRMDNQSAKIPVIYAGQINGGKMKLTIKRKDTQKSLGSFTLKRGEEAFIVKCR
ncbi:MAG: hypothetical protein JNK38_09355 [Acidobacteria bacterium]|nr:hypothetical protein [Acidobacteriota bacterium]